MTGLPGVPPDVTARGVELLPGRLRRRLDDAVDRAREWPLAPVEGGLTITVDPDVTVSITIPVRGDDDVRCSCLLAPACLHRAAVLSLAPPEELPDPGPAPAPASPGTEPHSESPSETEGETQAVEHVWRAAGDLLSVGITGAGAVHQSVLLRAAHDARAAGLPRLSSAALRVVTRVRAARAETPEFRLADLVDDVRELLATAYGLRTGHGDLSALRGTTRRVYRPVGNLRLYGLCCETVVTASGYGGAVTHLVDATGALWQLGSVTPGGVGLAAGRPDALVTIGEARISYRALAHSGLRLIQATGSVDGRLGTGGGVQAVAAPGAGWDEEPLRPLWGQSLTAQVARYHRELSTPERERTGGYDLAFLDATIAGHTERGLSLNVDGGTATLAAPTDEPGLPYVDNLGVLARAVGARLRVVGRIVDPQTVHGLAVMADWLSHGGTGHLDLGIDRLQRSDVGGTPGALPVGATAPTPPVHLLNRRLERCVEGGRLAVPGAATDPARLRAASLHTAALLAQRLDTQAAAVSRDAFGRVETDGNEALVLAWLAAAIYLATPAA